MEPQLVVAQSSPRARTPRTPGRRTPRRGGDPIASFFHGRVNSSRGFIARGSHVMAIPFGTRRAKTPDARQAFSVLTEYRYNYKVRPYCFSSMDEKPLERYSPDASRSKNAMPDVSMPYKNSSCIQFDSGFHVCKQRAFATTSQLHMTGEMEDPRSNPGILAQEHKYRKARLAR